MLTSGGGGVTLGKKRAADERYPSAALLPRRARLRVNHLIWKQVRRNARGNETICYWETLNKLAVGFLTEPV
ncbi:MAG: hypothetical protein KDE51_02540 [Anaerolineales bacterium]|nr:hypothetical protein [Anaerolineales bacterium]